MMPADGAGPERWSPPSEAELQRLVDRALRGYFADRRARIDGFVDRHFTFNGSLKVHRRALGSDLLKAPANVLLAVPNVLVKLGGAAALGLRARVAGRWLLTRRLLFETDVGREVECGEGCRPPRPARPAKGGRSRNHRRHRAPTSRVE